MKYGYAGLAGAALFAALNSQPASPQAGEISTEMLQRHRAICEETGADSCVISHRGRIVQEWYGPRYARPVYGMSTTKSVAGLLVGMLIGDGKIRTADQPVCEFEPTWCSGNRGLVTIRHLLAMTSGLPKRSDSGVGVVHRKNQYVLGLTPTSEPGTTWAYSNEGVQLLSPVLSKAAGEPIQDYAKRRLFDPAGMKDTRLHVFMEAWTYADMETTAHDLAQLGVLMLNKGRAGDRQVVPADWINASTTSSQSLQPDYGLLWWLHPEVGAYAAHGHLDTHVHIIPRRELVVVRTQAKPVRGLHEGDYERKLLALLKELR